MKMLKILSCCGIQCLNDSLLVLKQQQQSVEDCFVTQSCSTYMLMRHSHQGGPLHTGIP